MPILLAEPIVGLGSGSPEDILRGSGRSVPAGVEAILEFNGLYLNVLNNLDRYKVKSIDGLVDDADMTDQREKLPNEDGETAFPGTYAGKPITIQGTIEAHDLQKMRDMIQALRQAFNNIRIEQQLTIHGASVEQKVFVMCKKAGKISIQEAQNDMRFWRDFSIPLRASNPRLLSLERPSLTVAGLGVGPTSIMSVINNGDYEAQTIIRLVGGYTEPRITNLTNGTMARFKPTVVIPAGLSSVREISSMQSDKYVIDGAGANKYNEITLDSTWLTLEPGINNIEFRAAAVSGVAGDRSLTFFWRHSWK